jgi:polyisoprenoid-binding protein YceI
MTVDFDTTTSTAIQDITGDYSLDVAHTRVGFTARHAMVTSVRGSFADFEGTAHLDAADPARSSAKLVIKAASISTGQEQRDAHLRSPDFFDVENYPEITFVSTDAERVDEETYRLAGDLTVKDVTKPITVEFTYNGSAKDPFGNLRAGFEGQATLRRKDWGLTWNAALETGGFLVSDKIKLEFDVSAVKLTPTA